MSVHIIDLDINDVCAFENALGRRLCHCVIARFGIRLLKIVVALVWG